MRSLRTQLLISHMSLVLLLALVMSAGITSLFRLYNDFERILAHNFATVVAATDAETALADQARVFDLLAQNQSARAELLDRDSWARFENAMQKMSFEISSDTESRLMTSMVLEAKRYRVLSEGLLEANSRLLQPDLREKADRELLPSVQRLRFTAAQLGQINEREILEENDRVRRNILAAAYRSLAVTLCGVLLAIILALRMVRMALKPLAILARYADSVGAGDLSQTIQVPRQDEIGALADSFNSMVGKLSEVRSAEVRRLQRAEQMTDAALEYLYDPVIVTDAKGRIAYLNRAAAGLFGPLEGDRRKPVDEHVTDMRIVRAIQKAISANAVTASEDEKALVPIRVGEADRIYRLRVAPMTGSEGNVLGAVAIMEDITHLRVVDRMKNEFIGVASHELRTPVTSLLLSVQLLEEGALGELTEAQKEVVAAQRSDLERLEKLMRELLDVTRLESGSNPPRFVLTSPNELMASPVRGLASEAQRNAVDLRMESCEDCGQLRADRSQIGRVLTNLISNAIRHTPRGGRVTVRALATPDEVTFQVEDTGDGIPREYLKSIFDRFVQVPGATQGGAGLGLSIAQSIVRAHGGRMNVQSEERKGSVFSFSLPRDPSAAGGENTV
ncbi:MAG TPA: ATP-binding protein [Fimbriimonas sp.]